MPVLEGGELHGDESEDPYERWRDELERPSYGGPKWWRTQSNQTHTTYRAYGRQRDRAGTPSGAPSGGLVMLIERPPQQSVDCSCPPLCRETLETWRRRRGFAPEKKKRGKKGKEEEEEASLESSSEEETQSSEDSDDSERRQTKRRVTKPKKPPPKKPPPKPLPKKASAPPPPRPPEAPPKPYPRQPHPSPCSGCVSCGNTRRGFSFGSATREAYGKIFLGPGELTPYAAAVSPGPAHYNLPAGLGSKVKKAADKSGDAETTDGEEAMDAESKKAAAEEAAEQAAEEAAEKAAKAKARRDRMAARAEERRADSEAAKAEAVEKKADAIAARAAATNASKSKAEAAGTAVARRMDVKRRDERRTGERSREESREKSSVSQAKSPKSLLRFRSALHLDLAKAKKLIAMRQRLVNANEQFLDDCAIRQHELNRHDSRDCGCESQSDDHSD